MNLEQAINSSMNEFRQNILDFCKNEEFDSLTPDLSVRIIGYVKEQLKVLGLKTVQSYFESKDIEKKVIEYESKPYLYKYKSKKEVLTVLGKIDINRSVYQQARGGKSKSPLDIMMGVDHQFMTPDVKEILLFSSAHNTPEETSQIVGKCSLFELHPTTIKRVIENTGLVLEDNKEFIDSAIKHTEEKPQEDGKVVVCSMDGVNILLKESGKRKGRPTERPKQGDIQTRSSYKNAMCGSISYYDVLEKDGSLFPERILSKYTARMPEERYSTFKFEFESELKNITEVEVKILLTDAHKSIMGYVKDNPMFEEYEHLIDFFHATEHLSLLAEIIWGKSNTKAQEWYLKYYDKLKNSEDGILSLIRSAEYYMGYHKLSKTKLQEAEKQVNYFKNNKKFMNYYRFVSNGWPIGSGVIEAACKSLVKQRMCRSGQRWTRKGGQTILSLRTYVKSNRWVDFWNNYKKIEYKQCA